MIIHRCDRCKRDFFKEENLKRIRIEIEEYVPSKAYYNPVKTVKVNVCNECIEEFKGGFDDFMNKGVFDS